MAPVDELISELGTESRGARKQAGLTQQQLGELAGLSLFPSSAIGFPLDPMISECSAEA